MSRSRATGARLVVPSDVAPVLREAIVATEDERYYHHQGIDVIGVLRAVPYDVGHLSFAQGASTISEQVAKLLYLGGNDHSPWRKLKAAVIALRLEDHSSKAQILSAYLNSTYFGEGAYGAAAASETYFGIVPKRLTLAEASLLAGLIQAPSAYDPIVAPRAARARQAQVLRSMVRNDYITANDARRALVQPLLLRRGRVLAGGRG